MSPSTTIFAQGRSTLEQPLGADAVLRSLSDESCNFAARNGTRQSGYRAHSAQRDENAQAAPGRLAYMLGFVLPIQGRGVRLAASKVE